MADWRAGQTTPLDAKGTVVFLHTELFVSALQLHDNTEILLRLPIDAESCKLGNYNKTFWKGTEPRFGEGARKPGVEKEEVSDTRGDRWLCYSLFSFNISIAT